MIQANATSVQLFWNPVKFCGVNAPPMLDSVNYTIEVAEGVDWKESALSKYMNDMTAMDYRVAFKGKNVTDVVVGQLKPAVWYHFRIVIEYLGLKVMSESFTTHTLRCPPSPPPQPKVTIVPVRNSFDVKSDIPVRLEILISWLPSASHGSEIERYQVHLKRFDEAGNVLNDDPPFLKKNQEGASSHPQKAIAKMMKVNKLANQWIGSPGRNELEIRNSLSVRTGQRSVSPPDSRHLISRVSRQQSPPSSPNHQSNYFLSPNASGEAPALSRSFSNSPSAWRIVYDNLNRTFKLGSPQHTDAVWWIRVRAKNNEGWSPFSEIKIMNQVSYPTLFPHIIPAPRSSQQQINTSKDESKVQELGSRSKDSADSQFSVRSIPPEFQAAVQRPVTRGKPLMMDLDSGVNNNRPPRPDTRSRQRDLQLPEIAHRK